MLGSTYFGLAPVSIVSVVVPFRGLPCRILNIELVGPKKGTTMETLGVASTLTICSLGPVALPLFRRQVAPAASPSNSKDLYRA